MVKISASGPMPTSRYCDHTPCSSSTSFRRAASGEPGTTLVSVAADPNEPDSVWVWEEFADGDAVQAHFQHDFFQALQLELADLLAEHVAVRPMAPVARLA